MRTAIDAARTAGQYLLDNFGKGQTVHVKGDRNLVTDADRKAQDIITGLIESHFPAHGIIAEEGPFLREQAEYLWIVDPLDGTHNYIRGIGIFGVSIGIVRGNSYIAGVIYMPLDKEMYVGEKGNGAYKDDKKISVSPKAIFSEYSVSFDSALRYAPLQMLPVLGELAQRAFNVRMFGSSARALSYLAEGKIDVSVEFEDQPWDCAAGICLIEQAGGRVTDLSGNPMSYTTMGYIATNGQAHQDVLDIIRSQR